MYNHDNQTAHKCFLSREALNMSPARDVYVFVIGQNVGGTLVGGIVFRFSRGQKYKTIEGDEIVRQSKWGDT